MSTCYGSWLQERLAVSVALPLKPSQTRGHTSLFITAVQQRGRGLGL